MRPGRAWNTGRALREMVCVGFGWNVTACADAISKAAPVDVDVAMVGVGLTMPEAFWLENLGILSAVDPAVPRVLQSHLFLAGCRFRNCAGFGGYLLIMALGRLRW
jgi:hypothetical protein